MRWVPPSIWSSSALSGLWVRLVALKVLVWRFVPCYPVHEILNRTGSSVLVWEESVARRFQRSPKPIWFSTEQVNLMSLKMRREEWLFAPIINNRLTPRLNIVSGKCLLLPSLKCKCKKKVENVFCLWSRLTIVKYRDMSRIIKSSVS